MNISSPNCTCYDKPTCLAGTHPEKTGKCGYEARYDYFCCVKDADNDDFNDVEDVHIIPYNDDESKEDI